MLKPTFAFLDESGTLDKDDPQQYFAVGAIIDTFPDGLLKNAGRWGMNPVHAHLLDRSMPAKYLHSYYVTKYSFVNMIKIMKKKKKITLEDLKNIYGEDWEKFEKFAINKCYCGNCKNSYNSTIVDFEVYP